MWASISEVSGAGSVTHAAAISTRATAVTAEGVCPSASSATTVNSVGDATSIDVGFQAERPPVNVTSPTLTSPVSWAPPSSFTVRLCLAALPKTWVSTMSSASDPSSNDAPLLLGLEISGRIVVDGSRLRASAGLPPRRRALSFAAGSGALGWSLAHPAKGIIAVQSSAERTGP